METQCLFTGDEKRESEKVRGVAGGRGGGGLSWVYSPAFYRNWIKRRT